MIAETHKFYFIFFLSALCLLLPAYLLCSIWCKHTFVDTVAVL